MTFDVCAHPLAPVLSNASPEEASTIIVQLASDMASPNARLAGEFLSLVREACLVNLFFWLRFVCSFSGPYDLLNGQLHLEMCNFRQSDLCMAPGARFGISTTRGFYKSTIGTHGADSWELLRDPSIRIRLVNAIVDRAMQFLAIVQNTFSRNELVGLLFPAYYVTNPRSQANWNATEMVLPNRPRFFSEPNIKVGAATGSSEGDHHDLLDIDDLIGLDDLTADRRPNSDMDKKRNWFRSNRNALLVNTTQSRVGCKFTRYGPDDVYEDIFDDLKRLVGFQADWAKVKTDGHWGVYYRMGRENGKASCPDILPDYEIDRIAREDRWYYLTQIQNSPYEAGMAEFRTIDPGQGHLAEIEVELADGSVSKELCLVLDEGMSEHPDYKPVPLRFCDKLIAYDPAATERGMLSKVCRTAIVFLAVDHLDRVWLIKTVAGFFSLFDSFDKLFEIVNEYPGQVRTIVVETNAFQKVLEPLLEKEREDRGIWVNFTCVSSTGDKEARIRSIIGSRLAKGQFVCCQGTFADFEDEKSRFPQNRYRMDLLDAIQLGISELREPLSEEETNEAEAAEDEMLELRSVSTGY